MEKAMSLNVNRNPHLDDSQARTFEQLNAFRDRLSRAGGNFVRISLNDGGEAHMRQRTSWGFTRWLATINIGADERARNMETVSNLRKTLEGIPGLSESVLNSLNGKLAEIEDSGRALSGRKAAQVLGEALETANSGLLAEARQKRLANNLARDLGNSVSKDMIEKAFAGKPLWDVGTFPNLSTQLPNIREYTSMYLERMMAEEPGCVFTAGDGILPGAASQDENWANAKGWAKAGERANQRMEAQPVAITDEDRTLIEKGVDRCIEKHFAKVRDCMNSLEDPGFEGDLVEEIATNLLTNFKPKHMEPTLGLRDIFSETLYQLLGVTSGPTGKLKTVEDFEGAYRDFANQTFEHMRTLGQEQGFDTEDFDTILTTALPALMLERTSGFLEDFLKFTINDPASSASLALQKVLERPGGPFQYKIFSSMSDTFARFIKDAFLRDNRSGRAGEMRMETAARNAAEFKERMRIIGNVWDDD